MFEVSYKIKGHHFIKNNEDQYYEFLSCKNCKYNDFVYAKNSGANFYVVNSLIDFGHVYDCEIYCTQPNLNYKGHELKITEDYKRYLILKCHLCNGEFEFMRLKNYYGNILTCNEEIIKRIIE